MEAERIGYLRENFRLFHIRETNRKSFDFHYHDFHKLLFLVEGSVSYNIEGNLYHLHPNDIVLIHHGEIHCPEISKDCSYERYIFYISPSYLKEFQQKNISLEQCFHTCYETGNHVLRFRPHLAGILLEKLKKVEKQFQDHDFGHELLEENAFLEFLIYLNRFHQMPDSIFLPDKTDAFKMAPVIHYIHEHLTQPLSIEQIAAAHFLSPSYLMHSFKKETGYTIGNYISTKRLFLARDYILQGSSVLDACFSSGFSDYTTFSRAYKKMFSETPKDLR